MFYLIHTHTDSKGIFSYICEDEFETKEEAIAKMEYFGDFIDNPQVVEAENETSAIAKAQNNDNYEEPEPDYYTFDERDFFFSKKGAAGYKFDKDGKTVTAWFGPWEYTRTSGSVFIDNEIHDKKIAEAK